MYGRAAFPTESATSPTGNLLLLSDWQAHQQRIQQIIYPAISDAVTSARSRQSIAFADRHRTIPNDYFPSGAIVMVRDVQRDNKVSPPYVGPYTILTRLTSGSYVLKDAQNIVLTRTVPASFMKLVTRVPSASPASPSDEKAFEVSHIGAHRGSKSAREYLTYWIGYDDPTWVPSANFDDLGVIEAYWRSLKVKKKSKSEKSSLK